MNQRPFKKKSHVTLLIKHIVAHSEVQTGSSAGNRPEEE